MQIYSNPSLGETKNSENFPNRSQTFNGSVTQANNYAEITADGTRKIQKEKVLEVIKTHGPLVTRRIAKEAGIEVTAASRCIKDLENNIPRLIRVAFTDKSPVTGKLVNFMWM